MNSNITNNSALKKKKIKRKFNIIDFLVLIIIIAVVGGAIYAVFSWSNIKSLWSTSTVELQYTVELRGVDKEFISKIKAGDTVTDAVSKNQLGIVERVDSIEKYTVLDYTKNEIQNDDGKSSAASYSGVLSEYPDKYNITVYISSSAEYEKGVGYTVNGRRVAVGEIIEMRFPEFSSVAYCVAGNFN